MFDSSMPCTERTPHLITVVPAYLALSNWRGSYVELTHPSIHPKRKFSISINFTSDTKIIMTHIYESIKLEGYMHHVTKENIILVNNYKK